jgi:hypothetical protein
MDTSGFTPYEHWLRDRKISRTTGFELRRRGLLRAVRIGARLFITDTESARFVEALEQQADRERAS